MGGLRKEQEGEGDRRACPGVVCGGGGRDRSRITVANGNRASPGRSPRVGVTSDGAENTPRLRVTCGEDSKEPGPPLQRRVETHTASAQDSSTPVPWRWRSRNARIRESHRRPRHPGRIVAARHPPMRLSPSTHERLRPRLSPFSFGHSLALGQGRDDQGSRPWQQPSTQLPVGTAFLAPNPASGTSLTRPPPFAGHSRQRAELPPTFPEPPPVARSPGTGCPAGALPKPPRYSPATRRPMTWPSRACRRRWSACGLPAVTR